MLAIKPLLVSIEDIDRECSLAAILEILQEILPVQQALKQLADKIQLIDHGPLIEELIEPLNDKEFVRKILGRPKLPRLIPFIYDTFNLCVKIAKVIKNKKQNIKRKHKIKKQMTKNKIKKTKHKIKNNKTQQMSEGSILLANIVNLQKHTSKRICGVIKEQNIFNTAVDEIRQREKKAMNKTVLLFSLKKITQTYQKIENTK